MHIRYRRHFGCILSVLTLVLLASVSFTGQSDLPKVGYVFLTDGTTLHGKIIREGNYISDAEHEIWIPKVGGFYLVDDGARHIVFSHHCVSEARIEPDNRPQFEEAVRIFRVLNAFPMNPSFVSAYVEEASQWDLDGWRTVTISQDGPGTKTQQLTQAITKVSPHWSQVETKTYRVSYRMLTSELDPAMTIAMIKREYEKREKNANNPAPPPKAAANGDEPKKDPLKNDAAEQPPKPQPKKPATPDTITWRLGLFRFCINAGWYEQAEVERQLLLKDFPDRKGTIEEIAKSLTQALTRQRADDIEMAFRSGQHEAAQKLLADFKEDGAAEVIAQKTVARKTQYQELNTQLADIRRLLGSVRKSAKTTQIIVGLSEALAEIERGLNRDTCGRLEPFRALAMQEEHLQGQGQKPANTPEQLLALAVTGWMLGNSGADNNTANALQLWQTRQMILRYLKERDGQQREQILSQYLKNDPVRYDVIKQLLELLPPPAPESTEKNNLALVTPGTKNTDGVKYRVQVPPEYHPQRAYPVLVVLPTCKDDLLELYNRWGPLAAKHGYLLVTPQWALSGQTEYKFTDREREVVPTVLRDLRRRFNVDCDRIVMFGYDHAGTMAYDVGLSRPDLFAGVAVMSARMGEVAEKHYRSHGQYLPFYVVEGDRRTKAQRDQLRGLFTYWVQRGFPSIYVEYIGRGVEYYPGELTYIMDWMDRKKRPQKLPKLGDSDGKELRIVRESDNRFYWLSTDDVVTGGVPAKLTAKLAENNSIVGQVSGVKQLTVWLNDSMVDFKQPVEVRFNQFAPSARVVKKTLEPSTKVLLEDFYLRGDKKNLYLAKVDLKW
jgi:hypothetical protein